MECHENNKCQNFTVALFVLNFMQSAHWVCQSKLPSDSLSKWSPLRPNLKNAFVHKGLLNFTSDVSTKFKMGVMPPMMASKSTRGQMRVMLHP